MSAPTPKVSILMDTREPEPKDHPWTPHWPLNVILVRQALETGDFALAADPTLAGIERKSVADLYACLFAERERFVRELARARFLRHFAVVCEGSLADLEGYAHQRSGKSGIVVPTIAAWCRDYPPIIFASTPGLAVAFAYRFLTQPLTRAIRLCRAHERAQRNSEVTP
jgi:ERCC4-type nuclease